MLLRWPGLAVWFTGPNSANSPYRLRPPAENRDPRCPKICAARPSPVPASTTGTVAPL